MMRCQSKIVWTSVQRPSTWMMMVRTEDALVHLPAPVPPPAWGRGRGCE